MIARNDFEVIPAIDVLEGRVVRLSEGRRDAITLEGGEPGSVARRFARDGAARLHLVDLDGAFTGTPSLALLSSVSSAGGLPLQVGGGYRTIRALETALEAGADRVIVGTAALSSSFLAAAVSSIGDALVVAVDVREGRVAVDGWTRASDLAPAELAQRCAEAGVARLLVTSTSRDGSLAGPDLELLDGILPVGLPVVAAGGIASTADVVALRELGCEAAVTGSALLAGRFTLAEAHAALGFV